MPSDGPAREKSAPRLSGSCQSVFCVAALAQRRQGMCHSIANATDLVGARHRVLLSSQGLAGQFHQRHGAFHQAGQCHHRRWLHDHIELYHLSCPCRRRSVRRHEQPPRLTKIAVGFVHTLASRQAWNRAKARPTQRTLPCHPRHRVNTRLADGVAAAPPQC